MLTLDQFRNYIDTYHLEFTIPMSISQVILEFPYANGCGAKGGTMFPATIWGINIEAACDIHDIEWKLSKSVKDLLFANENFDNNLKRICDPQSNKLTRWLRRFRIAKYVSGVELIGTNAYAIKRGFMT